MNMFGIFLLFSVIKIYNDLLVETTITKTLKLELVHNLIIWVCDLIQRLILQSKIKIFRIFDYEANLNKLRVATHGKI